MQPKPLTTSRRVVAPAGVAGGDEEVRSTPSTPPASARAFGGATFWDAPGRDQYDAPPGGGGAGLFYGGGSSTGSYSSPPIMTPGATRSRHVVKPIRGQQADTQQHAPSASSLSFTLLRTPRGGPAIDLAHRTPRDKDFPPPMAGSLTHITDGDEEGDD